MRQVRSKAQLTLPEEIRRALRISEGDEVEFCVHEDGPVTVRGYMSIPTDQAWFFTLQWLAGEREADEDIAAGGGDVRSPGRARRGGCLILAFQTLSRFERDWKDLTRQQQAMFRKVVLEAAAPDLMAPERPFRPVRARRRLPRFDRARA